MPGVFNTVTPFLEASPDLGRICASHFSGIDIATPVGIKVYSPGLIIISFFKKASKSIPEAPSLLKEGDLPLDLIF